MERGDDIARSRFIDAVYDELRRLARIRRGQGRQSGLITKGDVIVYAAGLAGWSAERAPWRESERQSGANAKRAGGRRRPFSERRALVYRT